MASATDPTAQPSSLDILTAYARRKGWALLLGCELGADNTNVARLTLVEPNRFTVGQRKHKIRAGRLVRGVELRDHPGLTVEDAAGLIVHSLARARQAA